MAGQLLPDELWNEIESLFPVYEPSPEGGRHPKQHRVVLTAILFVLKTGIGWKDLPTEAFGCSYKTCTRRIQEWSKLGLWQRMHELFLAKLLIPIPPCATSACDRSLASRSGHLNQPATV